MARLPSKGVHLLFSDSGAEAELLFRDPDADDGSDGPGVEALAPPLPPPPAHLTGEMSDRLGKAIEALRMNADRLGAEVAATAIEIGCLVARRILEAELTTNPEAHQALIRSAVRRLGDAHKVTIHLAPADLEAVRAAAGETPSMDLGMNLGIAKVDIVPDTNLTPGDCFVESDAATVDGRLGTRLEEIRRVLSRITTASEGESS
jgi:flagellar biosynthesis/type III secretory pathway protein FliH